MKIQKVLVLGAGLIGGSIIRAIRKYQPELILEVAVRNPAAYAQLHSFAEKVYPISEIPSSDWNLIIITTPTDTIAELVKTMASKVPEDSMITDAGSIKGPIEEACIDIPQYLGSHPMAGKEKGGFEHSDPDLLKNRVVAVCPKSHTPFQNIRTLCQFWENLGAETVIKTAAEHDEIVAYTSHFPHVISFLFANLGNDLNIQTQKIAGNSFADFTRIAASSPLMWTEVFRLNKKNLVFLLENFIKFLFDFKQAMERDDWVFIENTISQSNLFMEKLSNTKNLGSED